MFGSESCVQCQSFFSHVWHSLHQESFFLLFLTMLCEERNKQGNKRLKNASSYEWGLGLVRGSLVRTN